MMLINDDCLTAMDKLINDDVKVDLVLCDPPYGITDNKWDTVIPFEPMWDALERIKKDKKTPILFFASQPFTSQLVMSNPRWFRYEWIYQKTAGSNFGTVKYQPFKEHEEVLVFGEKSPYYYPIMEERKGTGKQRVQYSKIHYGGTISDNYGTMNRKENDKWYSELRYPSSVQKFNNRKSHDRGLHPNQKPIELLEYLIKTYTEEENIVLDFTMGSGSTGVACKNLNRNFIGIELDNGYFNIAKERINDAQTKLL